MLLLAAAFLVACEPDVSRQLDDVTELPGEPDIASDTEGADSGDGLPLAHPQLVTVEDAVRHEFHWSPFDDPLAMGPAAALLDVDGDLAVDLMLGDTPEGDGACLYLNRSTPGHIRFDPDPARCDLRFRRPLSAITGYPSGGTGEKVLVGASGTLGWLPSDDMDAFDNLFDTLLDTDDPRRRCQVEALTPFDIDEDGVLEVLVGCGHAPSTAPDHANMVLDGLDGTPFIWDVDATGPLADTGPTLAFGIMDVNGDDVLDVLVINDTLSGPGQRNTGVSAGGVVLRGDGEPGTWAVAPFADDESAWGSFMGVASITPSSDRSAATVFLTDRGPNRWLSFATIPPHPADLGNGADPSDGRGTHGADLFSWAAVTADFDADAIPDLYVSQGDVSTERIRADVDVGHRDKLHPFNGMEFAPALSRDELEPTPPAPPMNARSAIAADFDGDGTLELLTIPLFGRPRLDRVECSEGAACAPRVCTVIPSSTNAAVRSVGFRYRAAGLWWDAEIAGRARFGTPPFLTVPIAADRLRTPGGAEYDIQCRAGERLIFSFADEPDAQGG
jgi:hypothetical protein